MGTACRFGCTLSFVSLVLGCFCKVPAFPVDVRIVPTMRVDAASKKVCRGRVVSSSWQTSKVVSSRGRPTFKSSALRARPRQMEVSFSHKQQQRTNPKEKIFLLVLCT